MIYPKHVALIPDGNRTWAKEKWFPQISWHLEWMNSVVELTKYTFTHTPIDVFTTWWLSTENLKQRSWEELEYLFQLYKSFYEKLWLFLKEKKVNFKWAGNENWLPKELVEFLRQTEKDYNFGWNKYFILCINYWWQDEIVRWIKNYLKSNNSMSYEELIDKIDENELTNYLDFAWIPNVELVIRTKWNLAQRLSWFLTWTIWYAQLYFVAEKCPEFKTENYIKALEWFDKTAQMRNYWK